MIKLENLLRWVYPVVNLLSIDKHWHRSRRSVPSAWKNSNLKLRSLDSRVTASITKLASTTIGNNLESSVLYIGIWTTLPRWKWIERIGGNKKSKLKTSSIAFTSSNPALPKTLSQELYLRYIFASRFIPSICTFPHQFSCHFRFLLVLSFSPTNLVNRSLLPPSLFDHYFSLSLYIRRSKKSFSLSPFHAIFPPRRTWTQFLSYFLQISVNQQNSLATTQNLNKAVWELGQSLPRCSRTTRQTSMSRFRATSSRNENLGKLRGRCSNWRVVQMQYK